jgi:hypothetical protein
MRLQVGQVLHYTSAANPNDIWEGTVVSTTADCCTIRWWDNDQSYEYRRTLKTFWDHVELSCLIKQTP